MTRVVLAELIAIDRFHRSIAFPFVHGYLRHREIDSQWLRLGLPAGWRADPGAFAAQLEALAHAIGESGATHVLFNQPPGDDVAARLAEITSAPQLALLVDGTDVDTGSWPTVLASPASLDEFFGLGAGDAPGSLFESIAPDFSWRPVNDAAREAPSLPFLVCGDECTYRRNVANNEYFRDVDLSACLRAEGCAFCVRPAARHRWQTGVLELARRQLTALAATHPTCDGRLQIRAVGAPILREIEGFAHILREIDLPPADFLLDARADTLVRARPALERAFETLAGTEHAFHLALVGIESFVERELQRFNKGVTWEQNLEAIRTLFELEHDFPERFAFREHGGLSLILYTPWTEPEDLAFNLAVVRFCELGDLCGKLFTSRLRLYPSIPLGQLALRDDLVSDAYDDPLLDTARRNFYPDELPWRFANPALESVNRVLLRIAESGADSISRALDRAVERVPAARDSLRLALAVLDAAVLQSDVVEADELVGDAVEMLVPRATSPDGDWVHQTPPADPDLPSGRTGWRAPPPRILDSHVRHVAAVNLGIKPVARIEAGNFPEEDHARWITENVPAFRTRVDHAGAREMFIGRDEASIEKAMRATAAEWRSDDEESFARAARETGAMLGYPACCTEAFLARGSHARESYTWMHMLVRLDAPEEISPLINPGHDIIEHVPCSFDCAASLAKVERMLEAIREARGPAMVDLVRQRLEHPWLFLVDFQGETIELRAESEPGDRFRYSAGVRRGGEKLLDRVAEGDELLVEEQQLLVLRKGRLHAALGGRAFLWYHRRKFQQRLWRTLLDLELGCRRLEVSRPAAAPEPAREEESPERQYREISDAVEAALARIEAPREFAGFRVRAVDQNHHTRALVLLARPDASLRLLVAPASRAPHAYARSGSVAVMAEVGEQIDTVEKDAATRELARVLGSLISEEEIVADD